MPMSLVRAAACAAALTTVLASGCSADPQAAATLADPAQARLTVSNAWARATMADVPRSAGYFTITNGGSQPDTLLSASSPVSNRVEIHRTIIENDIARMRPVAELTIEAGATVKAEPGGLHLMLLELQMPLVAGSPVPLTLTFRDAGDITVQMMPRDAMASLAHNH